MSQCSKTTKDGKVRCRGSEGHAGPCFLGGVTLADFDRSVEEARREKERCEMHITVVLSDRPSETGTWLAFNEGVIDVGERVAKMTLAGCLEEMTVGRGATACDAVHDLRRRMLAESQGYGEHVKDRAVPKECPACQRPW